MYILIALLTLTSWSIFAYVKTRKAFHLAKGHHEEISEVYVPVIEAEAKRNDVKTAYEKLQGRYTDKLAELRNSEQKLAKYHIGVGTNDSISYTRLSNNTSIEEMESRLNEIKDDLKHLISNKLACICRIGNDVTVNGKKSEAKKLFNREIKLRIRCLDNEFKATTAVVDWNNISRLTQRAKDTFNEINRTGDIVKTHLSDKYLQLKIEELRVKYELKLSKQELKEQEREEAQLKREAEREEARLNAAAEKAEKERITMEKLVAKELEKLESSTEEQRALYELHKNQLETLREKEQRAVSLAQLTRAGYVYVISNPLSFGEGIVKIGMTRRADPNDRVKELGDASVPELFNVHAFAYTDDAPTLEKFLHNAFKDQRVNLVNNRKEFFFTPPEPVLDIMNSYEGDFTIEARPVES